MHKLSRMIFFLLSLLVLMSIYFKTLAAWPFTTDDAFITLRYAQHWYFHHTLLSNLNGTRVEGYSNFLYVIFGYIAYGLHINPVLLIKIIGSLSLFGSAIFTYLIARFWLTPIYALLPTTLMAYNPNWYWWGVSGLETIFFQLLFLASIYFLLRGLGYFFTQPNANNHILPIKPIASFSSFSIFSAFFVAFIAALTRFDACIVFFALLLITGCYCIQNKIFQENANKNDLKKIFIVAVFFLFYMDFILLLALIITMQYFQIAIIAKRLHLSRCLILKPAGLYTMIGRF